MTDPYDELVCSDCACWWANGDLSALDLLDDADRDARYAEVTAAAGVPDGCTVVVGDGEGDFTWRGCDACRSPLGGDRVPAAFIDMRKKSAE